jgi:uncharacterized protein
MTRRDGAPRFAEHFAASGVGALVVDFRHLGDSVGEPRQLIDFERQCADLRAAVAFARSVDGLDPCRIALWGFSLGGGIVLATAAELPDISAAVLLCPVVDGLAFSLAGNRRNARRVFALSLRALIRREKGTLPVVGSDGGPVLFTQAEAAPGFEAVTGEGSLWRNEIRFDPARPVALFRPVRTAARVRCPLLVCLGTADTIAPGRPIEKVALRAPAAELQRFPVDHFQSFLDGFEAVAAAHVDFLARHLKEARAT